MTHQWGCRSLYPSVVWFRFRFWGGFFCSLYCQIQKSMNLYSLILITFLIFKILDIIMCLFNDTILIFCVILQERKLVHVFFLNVFVRNNLLHLSLKLSWKCKQTNKITFVFDVWDSNCVLVPVVVVVLNKLVRRSIKTEILKKNEMNNKFKFVFVFVKNTFVLIKIRIHSVMYFSIAVIFYFVSGCLWHVFPKTYKFIIPVYVF